MACILFLEKKDKKSRKYQEKVTLNIIKEKLRVTKGRISTYKENIRLFNPSSTKNILELFKQKYKSEIIEPKNASIIKLLQDKKYILRILPLSKEYIISENYYEKLDIDNISKVLNLFVVYNEQISSLNESILIRNYGIYGNSNDINQCGENMNKCVNDDIYLLIFISTLFEASRIVHSKIDNLLKIILKLEKEIEDLLK